MRVNIIVGLTSSSLEGKGGRLDNGKAEFAHVYSVAPLAKMEKAIP